MAPRTIEFWFDFGSTYSYPAAMRVEAMAGLRGWMVDWQPFLLGPIFSAQGWNDSPFNLYPAKGRYMFRDLARICAQRGLEWRRPSRFPRNGLLAARVATASRMQPWLPAFVRRVYRANFAFDREIAEPEVVGECLHGLASDPDAVLAAASHPETKAELRRNTERAVALGIFGAPSFRVDGELFWGDDRLEDALTWAGSSAEG